MHEFMFKIPSKNRGCFLIKVSDSISGYSEPLVYYEGYTTKNGRLGIQFFHTYEERMEEYIKKYINWKIKVIFDSPIT